MAVNSLFKKLKVNFDDVKVLLGELSELAGLRQDRFQVQRDIQEREVRSQAQEHRLRRKLECDCEEQSIRHSKALEDLEREAGVLHAEVARVEQEAAVIQNELHAQQAKLENIRRETKLIEEHIAVNKELERHQDSLAQAM